MKAKKLLAVLIGGASLLAANAAWADRLADIKKAGVLRVAYV